MPTLNDIDDSLRRCDSALVRQSCGFERGGDRPTLSPETWAKYRRICRVPANAKRLTDREAFLLLVCASEFRRGWQPGTDYRAAYYHVLMVAERKLEVGGVAPLERLKAIAAGSIPGSKLVEVLRVATGRSLSEQSLYRWGKRSHLPKFSRRAEYSPDQVRRFINAAG